MSSILNAREKYDGIFYRNLHRQVERIFSLTTFYLKGRPTVRDLSLCNFANKMRFSLIGVSDVNIHRVKKENVSFRRQYFSANTEWNYTVVPHNCQEKWSFKRRILGSKKSIFTLKDLGIYFLGYLFEIIINWKITVNESNDLPIRWKS